MAESGNLSERKKLILKSVIEAYIKSGEPIGSKYLTQEMQIPYSSATIRNEMAELADMGYLEQPHTSAGRVPSEAGYRFYVDELAQQYDISNREAIELGTMLNEKISEIDKLLENAMRAASAMTNYTALSLRPTKSHAGIVKYEVVPLDPRNFILVMITPQQTAKTKNVKLDADADEIALRRVCAALNLFVTNKSVDEINISALMQLQEALPDCGAILSPTLKAIYEVLNEIRLGDVKFDGINHLLDYPEYADRDRLRDMLALFEGKDGMIDAVSRMDQESDDVQVLIGSENTNKSMDNSTLIYRNVKVGDRTLGAIAVIGPCRMDYSKVIAMIDKLSEEIGKRAGGATLPPGDDGK